MKQSFIRVLGSADWHQTAYNDHSCYTICDKILIDACPSVITQLLEHDVDPLGIRTVCFIHMHCDHYMGLAPLLHYWRVCRDRDLGELTIVGPKATVRKFVMKAMDFLFDTHINECVTVMPRIIEVGGGDTVDIPGFHIDVLDGDHPTPDVCYRITDLTTGHAIGLTGDTRYLPTFGAFFHDVDLLVHEASYGGTPRPEAQNTSKHSSAVEAVRVCQESGAKSLLLTHSYEPKRPAALKVAHRGLDIPVEWAVPHHTFTF